MRDYLSFDVSDMISTAMAQGMMDATVIVCDTSGMTEDEAVAVKVSGLCCKIPIDPKTSVGSIGILQQMWDTLVDVFNYADIA